eukprot:TRINITY_DN7391_c0_g1_i2.p2 TRINITY_DN7391_c0_g1~~TRINITY_DN7391_c0_g1_i2.p2  ORF type:complete len:101 (+),score=3.22 TRINITY_DN7391_c0_g1_i2:80-382(+)
MTCLGCPNPVGSIIKRSGFCLNKTLIPTDIGTPAVQHMQPPGTSLISAPPSAIIAPSIPTSPNSLTSTAQFSFSGFDLSRLSIVVVLPTPRKPVMMLVGT